MARVTIVPKPGTPRASFSFPSSSIISHFMGRLSDRSCGRPKRHVSPVGKPIVVGMNARACQSNGDHETRIVTGFHAGWRRDEAYLVSANAPRGVIEGLVSALKNV